MTFNIAYNSILCGDCKLF